MRISFTHPNIKRQAGVSVVTAIFLIVVLALMGVGMVSLLSTSQQSISQEVTSAKTYAAGNSCAQWAMYQAAYNATFGTHTNTFNNAASSLFNTECNVTLTQITNDGITFYNIDISARYGNATDPEHSQRNSELRFQP